MSEINWNMPIKTQGGANARLLGSIKGDPYTKAVAVENDDGTEAVLIYLEDGRLTDTTSYNTFDLVNACTAYVNCYLSEPRNYSYHSLAEADSARITSEIGVMVKITYLGRKLVAASIEKTWEPLNA